MGSEAVVAPRAAESEKLFRRARESLVGGVDSPVRAFHSVGGMPRFVVSGKGANIRDADVRQYLDFCMSWCVLVLGHANPAIVLAVRSLACGGLMLGACVE